MAHEFEIAHELTLDATPEQVWQAIATGPGVDSWFMGRTEIEPGEGGARRLDLTDEVGVVQQSTVTAWEPGRRLVFREHDSPDGTFSAVEYLLEGRDGGSTVLRFVHSGVLGDDWEAEYDGMKAGDLMFLEQLAAYLAHFPGRHATRNLFLVGPAVPDTARVWSRFAAALSLTGEITRGAPVRLTVPGLPATDGVVEFVGHPHFVGLRTARGLHLLVKGYRDVLCVGYHGFPTEAENEDDDAIESAWRAWLASAAA
jgi:uncharacterized protein YndB with AHSA1/START domain